MEPNQAEVEIAFPIARGALTQSEVCHKELKIQKKGEIMEKIKYAGDVDK